MTFKRTSIEPTSRRLSREEKLQLEINASTRTPDHEKKYAAIAELASTNHENRLAKQRRVSELEKAANAVMAFEVEIRQSKSLEGNG